MANSKYSSVFSDDGPIFGREQEATAFQDVLDSAADTGMAVVTVGQVGMGKTTLLRKFSQVAQKHPRLKCEVKNFILVEQDDPDKFLDKLVHETFGMVRASDGRSKLAGPNWKKQVAALFGIVGADKLFESMLGQEWNPSWQKLLDLFIQLSEKMDANRRLVFFIDPSKHLRPDSGSAWLTVVERLPPKFVLVFAQRPDDALCQYPDFRGPKVRRIPDTSLPELDPEATEGFIRAGLDELSNEQPEAAKALRKYGGWPYAIKAGLLLLKRGVLPADLPNDPDKLAESLIEQVAKGQDGERGIELVYALAIFEVPVPMNVLTAFLGKSAPALRSVLGDPFVKGLVPKGQDGYEIFHSLLADQVRSQIKEDDNWIRLQEKAVRVFEKRLAKDERDSLALRRLSSHVYEAYEPAKYVKTVDRLSNQKYTLGMILEAISELEFALLQTQQPEYKAAFYGNLGVLYWTRGDLDRAEEMMRNALAINEELGRKEGMASGYGNLGNLYETRGDLDRAEELLKQACSIYLTIGAGGKNLHIFEEAIDRIKAIKEKRK